MNQLIPIQVLGKLTASMDESMRSYAVVRLYKGKKGGSFSYTKVWGALFVAVDESKGDLPVFKIIDMASAKCLWEHEIYAGMDFQKINKYWLGFEGDDDGVWAFSFAEGQQVNQFHKVVVSMIPAVEQKKKGFFSRLFGGSKKAKKEKKPASPQQPRARPVIGKVSNFQRKMHVGFNLDEGFRVENMPDAWKDLFSQAGITNEDLKDKKTAKKIFKAMKGFERQEKGGAGPRKKPKRPPRRPPVKKNELKKKPAPPSRGGLAPPGESGGLLPPPSSGGLAPPGAGGLAPPSGGLAPPPSSGGLTPPGKLAPPGSLKIKKGSPSDLKNLPKPQGGREDLLAAIRKGTTLKKVKKDKKVKIDLDNMSADKKQDLMSVLQASIITRRGKLTGDDAESDDDDSDDDFDSDSDDDW